MNQGYVYAPYIIVPNPVGMTSGFAPSEKIASRYATTMINSSFYNIFGNDDFEFHIHKIKMIERRKKLDKIILKINKD